MITTCTGVLTLSRFVYVAMQYVKMMKRYSILYCSQVSAKLRRDGSGWIIIALANWKSKRAVEKGTPGPEVSEDFGCKV